MAVGGAEGGGARRVWCFRAFAATLQVFGVRGSGFRVQGSGCSVQGARFRIQCSGFRVQGSGCRVQGPGFRVQGSGFRVQCSVLGFRRQGFAEGGGMRVRRFRSFAANLCQGLQGYRTYKKMHLLGPYRWPMLWVLGES